MGRRARAWASCHDAAWTAARFEAIHAAALDASV
jgi:hypothetical protein